jgi:arylsulfatase A-like enzyme
MKCEDYPISMKKTTIDRRLLFWAMLALLWIASQTNGQKRPNLLFIFSDDHCEQALSAYDPSKIVTPNLDRIANDGMRFTRCYVTNSICGPSRACIQTGKYSHLNGFYRNGAEFDGSQQTFPKLLQKAGYQTAIVGKWHLVSTPVGYDYFDVLIGQGPYYNPLMKTQDERGTVVEREHIGYTTDIITDKTLAWLKTGRNADQPFMLMFQHKAPHRDWQPPLKYLNWLDDQSIPEPETLFDDYRTRASPASKQYMEIGRNMKDVDLKLTPPTNLTPDQLSLWNAGYAAKNLAFERAREHLSEKELLRWKYQRYVKDYLRCVRSMDDNVGRVLDYLEESGLSENTVVIYSSDQGWYLGEHGWFDKRWMYEESLKTPLLIKWPGVARPGSVRDEIVSNLDFAETFLDLAGVSIPSDMQGESLVPSLKGESPPDWRTSFYYHYYEYPGAHDVARHAGVTNGDYKLIRFYMTNEWELYDLNRDPHELDNVYGNPNYKKIEIGLAEELERLRIHFGVPERDPDITLANGIVVTSEGLVIPNEKGER